MASSMYHLLILSSIGLLIRLASIAIESVPGTAIPSAVEDSPTVPINIPGKTTRIIRDNTV